MPYGIKNETPEQTRWMEGCISGITGTNKRTGKPYTEGEKIAICKSQLGLKSKKSESGALDVSFSEESLHALEDKIRRALEPFRADPIKEYPSNMWISDFFEDYVILEVGNDLFKVPWKELENEEIEFDFNSKVKVNKVITYEPVTEVAEANHVHIKRRLTSGVKSI